MSLDLRLSLPVAVAWLVAVLLIGVPQWSVVTAIALWIAAGIAIAVAVVSRRGLLASVALACALAALCSTSVAAQEEVRQPAMLVELAARHAQVEVYATTTSTSRPGDDYFRARVTSILVDGETTQLDSPALIFRESDRFGVSADPSTD